MLLIFVTIIHVIMCLILVAIVLLQTGKGADMGSAFGGASQTLFGGAGPANFLNRVTTIAAIVFMFTSLSLAILSSRGGSSSKVLDASPVQETQTVVAETPTPAAEMSPTTTQPPTETTTVPAEETSQTQPSAETTIAPVDEQKTEENMETAPQATPTN